MVLALASLLVVFSLASLRIFQLFGTFLDVRGTARAVPTLHLEDSRLQWREIADVGDRLQS